MVSIVVHRLCRYVLLQPNCRSRTTLEPVLYTSIGSVGPRLTSRFSHSLVSTYTVVVAPTSDILYSDIQHPIHPISGIRHPTGGQLADGYVATFLSGADRGHSCDPRQHSQSKYHTQLAKMTLDHFFYLTAEILESLWPFTVTEALDLLGKTLLTCLRSGRELKKAELSVDMSGLAPPPPPSGCL